MYMTKVYLAGPMRGIPHFNYPAFFRAAQELREQGYEVFNPAEGEEVYDNPTGSLTLAEKVGFNLRQTLKKDTEYICLYADTIAMLPGWVNSSGARAERALALALGLNIIYLEGWLDD